MPLKLVTITGADEWTDPQALTELSAEFPFVEWGLLLSLNRTGHEPRYPSMQHLNLIAGEKLRTSVHLCGSLARNAAQNKGWSIETALTVVPNAGRAQVNLGRDIDAYERIYWSLQSYASRLARQVIVQAYNFSIAPVTIAKDEDDDIQSGQDAGATFLHDSSGGRGLTSTFQKPVNLNFTGFAGGITPDNVSAKIDEIEALNFPNPYWIDVESGVRTDDRLDLAKVRRVLEIAAGRMGK